MKLLLSVILALAVGVGTFLILEAMSPLPIYAIILSMIMAFITWHYTYLVVPISTYDVLESLAQKCDRSPAIMGWIILRHKEIDPYGWRRPRKRRIVALVGKLIDDGWVFSSWDGKTLVYRLSAWGKEGRRRLRNQRYVEAYVRRAKRAFGG